MGFSKSRGGPAPTENYTVGGEAPTSNRRRHTRKLGDWSALVVSDEDHVYSGRCLDLSMGGIGVELPPGAKIGDVVCVTVFLDDQRMGFGVGDVVRVASERRGVSGVRLRHISQSLLREVMGEHTT